MKLRQWFNQHPAVAGVAAVVLLATSAGVMLLRGGHDRPTRQWFYDLNSGELFAGDGGQLAPIDAPSGKNQGVEAAVFSCGDCADPSQRYIGYLLFYTDYYKRAMLKIRESMSKDGKRAAVSTEEGAAAGGGGVMVRRVGDDDWLPLNSNDGAEIVVAPLDRCGQGGEARRCYPD